jgi:hypothetical protein
MMFPSIEQLYDLKEVVCSTHILVDLVDELLSICNGELWDGSTIASQTRKHTQRLPTSCWICCFICSFLAFMSTSCQLSSQYTPPSRYLTDHWPWRRFLLQRSKTFCCMLVGEDGRVRRFELSEECGQLKVTWS